MVIDVVDGVLQYEVLAPRLRFGTVYRGRGYLQIRLCGIEGRFFNGDCVLEGLFVQLGENISPVNTVVIIDQHLGYLPAYASSNERNVAVDECVIRRNRAES